MAGKSSLSLALAALACGSSVGAADLARIGPGSGLLGASEAVRVADATLAHTAQVLATDGSGALAGSGDPAAQIDQALRNLGHALSAAGSSLDRVVRLNAVVDSPGVAAELGRAIAAEFRLDSRPALTLVEGGLPVRGALVALDAVAVAGPGHPDPGEPTWLESASLPSVQGSSHCSILPAGPAVYVSGKAADGAPAEAAADVLRQLDTAMEFAGVDRTRVVQLKCFLRPITAAAQVQARIREHFGGKAPPTVFVEWTHGRTIEIEAIAAGATAGKDPPPVEYLTPPGDRASPVFSRIVRISHPESIFVSTLNGRTPGRGDLQIREMFSDLERILGDAGGDLMHLAKATYYVSDDLTSRALNEIRPEFYDPARPPAASKAPVRGTAVAGRSLAVDMIAVPVP